MSKTTRKSAPKETDNAYFLKILVYLLVGLMWIKINGVMIVPIGLIIGVIIAQHDHFAIDRKIEYAVLIVATILGLWGGNAILSLWFGQ